MPSIFSRIVAGEIPCHKVAETDDFLAFLDVKPIVRGHTLVIPKQEIDYLFDLPDDLYVGLHLFARQVAHALEKVVPCERIGTAVVGLEVPHAHLHLVPINHIHDMSFEKERIAMEPEAMAQLAQAIHAKVLW